MMFKRILTFLMIGAIALCGLIKPASGQDQKIAGVIFGEPVPSDNYFFALKTVLTFRSSWGGIPNKREELAPRIWGELALSYEAHRRGITATRSEIEEKLTLTLEGQGVSFDWRNEPQAYKQWVKDNLNGTVEEFENQMQHLVQLRKLHEQVLTSIKPTVTDKEALREFLNEYNNLSVELAEFEELTSAQEFYDKIMKEPEYWEKASKADRSVIPEDRSFRKPGFVTLEFLMDMWKFPEKAVYDMIDMKPGEFHPPVPIYEGYGVFKVLEIRRADESKFPERKKSYIKQLRQRKKHEGFKKWMEQLKKRADIQAYIEPPYEVLQ